MEGFVRPLLVVFADESSKSLLLGRAVGRRRPRGLGLQHGMKLFMRAILLRMARRNPLRHDPQAHPPHIELRQTAEPRAREWAAVVAADALRQSVVPKRTLEAMARRGRGAAEQGIAAQHESAEPVAQRQRIAIHAIARAKFAFEIGRPHLIGRCDRGQRRGGGSRRSRPATTRRHQPVLPEQRDRPSNRLGHSRAPYRAGRDREQLLRAPAWMPAPHRDQRVDHVGVRRLWAVLRPAGTIAQPQRARRPRTCASHL